jgi:pimeloyl-ACP methyl ester carboxylesterase
VHGRAARGSRRSRPQGTALAETIVMQSADVRELTIDVEGQPARVFTGGRGEPLLLIHGGWGGARLHWGAVWGRLAQSFQIIAPDLPGIGRSDQKALGSVAAYAQWIEALLFTMRVPSAWCVGNSFGASVACMFASEYSPHCRGLVLVNGIPMPASPTPLRWLGERPLGHRIMRALEKRIAYSPSALKRGFVNPAHVPLALHALVRSESPPQLDAFVDILVRGGSNVPPAMAPLLLWGEDDHLLGSSAKDARKLHASWPGAKLVFVPGAGHMPQLENPDAFVAALTSFIVPAAARAA